MCFDCVNFQLIEHKWYHKYDTLSRWKLRISQVDKTNMTLNPMDSISAGACPWKIQGPVGLSAPIQGVHLWMEAIVFGGPPILIMSILRLHLRLWLNLKMKQGDHNSHRWQHQSCLSLLLFYFFLRVDFCNFRNVRQRQPPGHSIDLLLSHRHRALPDLVTPLSSVVGAQIERSLICCIWVWYSKEKEVWETSKRMCVH